MSLVGLLILVIVFALCLYVIRILRIDPPFKTVAIVILCIIAILVLLGLIGVVPLGNLRTGIG